MKALAFFSAVFLCMLAFFVVATGEFNHWIGDQTEGPSERSSPKRGATATAADDPNMLDFDFWNVKLGRRSFTIRAELPSGDLRDGSRIDELEQLQLSDGIIEIPLYDKKELAPTVTDGAADPKPAELQKLILEFQRALYHRSGGLVKGGGEIAVILRDGKGSTNDGTEFRFEELLFTNSAPLTEVVPGGKAPGTPASGASKAGASSDEQSDKNRFSFRSAKPVSIVNRFLEVRSAAGLRGEIGQKGIERLEFLPPVVTYLDPSVVGDFALGSSGSEPEKGSTTDPQKTSETEQKSADEKRSRAVITCEGPLELRFGLEEEGSEKKDDARTRISFHDGVVVYNAEIEPGQEAPPQPRGNRFECRQLDLDIDDKGRRPTPRRAVATWKGGKVRTVIVRGTRTYQLEGDRLEWLNLRGNSPSKGGVSSEGKGPLSEGYLTGAPTLRGPDVDLHAERAVLRPEEDVVILERVQGVFRRDGRKLGKADSGGERAEEVVQSRIGTSPDTGPGAEGAGARGPDGRSSEPRELVVDFSAPEVRVEFAPDPKTGQKGFSRFVARGDGPQGVHIRSRALDEKTDGADDGAQKPPESGVPPFEARGQSLVYDAAKSEARLLGSADVLPRLTQGSSWIEARSIHFLVESGPQAAWFEDDVSARVDLRDFVDAKKGDATSNDGKKGETGAIESPQIFDIHADYLGLAFDRNHELSAALARANGKTPVELRTVSETPYRFFAREARLSNREKLVELFSGDTDPIPMARMEMEGGVVRARHIRFAEATRTVSLTDDVELRLFEGDKIKQKPDILVEAATAEMEILDGEERKKLGKPLGPVSQLRQLRSLTAEGAEDRQLVVEGPSCRLLGERVTWSSETRRLLFSGTGTQEIVVDSEELQGPVRAREIVFDESRDVVILQTAVRGELRQLPRASGNGAAVSATSASGSEGMRWEFETNALEIRLVPVTEASASASASGKKGSAKRRSRYELATIVARDKVVLYNPDQAVLLRGDDLLYEQARQRVQVYSRDGRRQTLQHFKDVAGAGRRLDDILGRAVNDSETAVDTIHAQRLVAVLMEKPRVPGSGVAAQRRLVVDFRKDVLANFYVEDVEGPKSPRKGQPGEHWQLIAQRLVLHIDPSREPKDPRAIPWAIASGSTEGTQRDVTINTGPYQALAATVEFFAPTTELFLIGAPGSPASIADRSPGRSEVPRAERHPVIRLRKSGSKVSMERRERAPGRDPWPGVPSELTD